MDCYLPNHVRNPKVLVSDTSASVSIKSNMLWYKRKGFLGKDFLFDRLVQKLLMHLSMKQISFLLIFVRGNWIQIFHRLTIMKKIDFLNSTSMNVWMLYNAVQVERTSYKIQCSSNFAVTQSFIYVCYCNK